MEISNVDLGINFKANLKCNEKLFLRNGKNYDMDWAHHIKMDFAQNLTKDPKKAKNDFQKAEGL